MAWTIDNQEKRDDIKTNGIKGLIIQFIKFGIVGLSNAAVSCITYAIVLYCFESNNVKLKYDYQIAWTISFIVSVAWAFYWNRKIVFKNKNESIKGLLLSLLKMYCSYAITGLLLSGVFNYIWIEVLGISKWLAPIITITLNIPLNFVLSKFWVFGKSK